MVSRFYRLYMNSLHSWHLKVWKPPKMLIVCTWWNLLQLSNKFCQKKGQKVILCRLQWEHSQSKNFWNFREGGFFKKIIRDIFWIPKFLLFRVAHFFTVWNQVWNIFCIATTMQYLIHFWNDYLLALYFCALCLLNKLMQHR